MKLIFIRHGDPDYKIDSLTEKGKKEAKLLADRVAKFRNVKEVYVSPLGRAVKTAEYSLNALNMKGRTKDWLREFAVKVKDPDGNEKNIPWDYFPSYWTNDPCFYDKDHWFESKLFEGSEIKENYDRVSNGLDEILQKNGYKRSGNLYLTDTVNNPPKMLTDAVIDPNLVVTDSVKDNPHYLSYQKNQDVILFFCHLGVSFVMISHLLGIAPTLLWHTFFTAPTSLTVLGAEEREPGIAAFRVQSFGDTSHLLSNHEPISVSGYFTNPLQY